MGLLSFIIGVGVGAVAMKVYMDRNQDVCEEQLQTEHVNNVIREEELAHSQNIEITTDGTVEIDPTDEEIIISTVKTLKRSGDRISLAAVVRESGLSKYKVNKHKDLIEKLKSE